MVGGRAGDHSGAMTTNDPSGPNAGQNPPPVPGPSGPNGPHQAPPPGAAGPTPPPTWQAAPPHASGGQTPPPHWQAGPPPGWQPGPPPGWQSAPGSTGFFGSLRNSGWYRADNRVIGGVCSGISARTGWDLGLVRGITVVLAIFLSPVWIAYGLAWALLPEQRDGRIHLEQLIHGRLDIAQLGAGVTILLGLGNPFSWFAWGGDGRGYWIFALVVVGIIVAIAALASSKGSDPRTRASQQWHQGYQGHQGQQWQQWQQGYPGHQGQTPRQTPPASPSSTTTAWRAQGGPAAPQRPTPGGPDAMGSAASPARPAAGPDAPTGPRSAAPGPGPAPAPGPMPAPGPEPSFQPGAWSQTSTMPFVAVPPTPAPPARRVSTRANLTVLGLLLLVVAGTLYYYYEVTSKPVGEDGTGLLLGTGTCLVLIGAALAIASIRDRRAGWLITMSIVAMLVAVPVGLYFPLQRSAALERGSAAASEVVTNVVGDASFDWTATSISGIGNVDLDLTAAPVDADKTISVQGAFGNLTVHVRQGQSVEFRVDGMMGSINAEYYTGADGTTTSSPWVPVVSMIQDSLDFRSDGWRQDAAITVDIDGGGGNLTIIEDQPASAAPNAPATGVPAPQSGDGTQSGDATPAPSLSPSPSGLPSATRGN